jgi:transposase
MTPTDEATFIALWQQGASQQELAQRLGVPVGTVKSRASALAPGKDPSPAQGRGLSPAATWGARLMREL